MRNNNQAEPASSSAVTAFQPSPEEYKRRRQALLDLLPRGSVAIFPAADAKLRNGDDSHYLYRQSSEVLYLTGFPEDEAVLVLTKVSDNGQGQFLLFVKERDPQEEQWNGKRIGIAESRSRFGADQVVDIRKFESQLPGILRQASLVYLSQDVNKELERQIRLKALQCGVSKRHLRRTVGPLGELRLIKSASELAIMQRSADIGTHAHNAGLMQCHAGMSEVELRSFIEHVFLLNGAAGPSYTTIVAGGENGNCLHHLASPDILRDGQLVLVDAGCEFAGYASDITRTYPVNGKFSPAQREIYELVLAAQEAAIQAVKPGVVWSQLNKICDDTLFQGLEKLGFQLTRTKEAGGKLSLDDLMPHGLGHWLGLDVHDVGEKTLPGVRNKNERPLSPGMVFTVEPGLYLKADDERIPARYRGINVRIEDNIRVTDSGYAVLTSAAFKSVADIEQMMEYALGMRREGGDYMPVVPAKHKP